MAQSGNFWGSKVKYVEGGRKFQKSNKFVENPSHETQHPVIAAIFIVKTKNFEILLTVCCLGRFPIIFSYCKGDIAEKISFTIPT